MSPNEKSLVNALDWSSERVQVAMIDMSAASMVAIGSTTVPVICEPLIRKEADGVRWRALRLDTGEALAAKIGEMRVSEGGVDIPFRCVPGPPGAVRFLVEHAEHERYLRLHVHDRTSEKVLVEVDVTVDVPREWTVHLVHHSHFDIGYTDTQPRIQAEQRSFLDSVLELCRATDAWPEASQFRWTVESLWVFQQWAALRPADDVDEFCQRVREGRIELTVLPYNLHTDTCSTDELHELLRTARALARRYGLPLSTAMQTDVPGTVVGLPAALEQVGVHRLAVAYNWAGRSMPQATGGDTLPRLFRWRSPAGQEVVVWMTDSPHGMAYMEGPLLGFHDGYAEVDKLLPAYLASMVRNPYPYPVGAIGWHGEAASTRTPYPHDVLHLRTQGWFGDNAPARLMPAEIVRRWNETWESPRLRMSTSKDFFDDVEQRLGTDLPVVEGDWGDWWVEGVGSAALEVGLVREAQARLTDAQVLSQAAVMLGGNADGQSAELSSAAYDAISMFNEHTWGASNSWLAADEGVDSGRLQWHWKAARALAGQELTEAFLERSAALLGAQLPRTDGVAETVYAFNTQVWPQSTVVRFLLRESVVPLDSPICVVDARNGVVLPHAVLDQVNPTHRQSGRWVSTAVPDVPGLGLVRLEVHVDAAEAEDVQRVVLQSETTPYLRGDVGYDVALPPSTPSDRTSADVTLHRTTQLELLVLRNEHLVVRYDDRRSAIASIVEVATGRELVNADALVGFNAYIYDTYTSAPGYNHGSNGTSSSPALELLGSRNLARQSVVLERADDGVEQRLVVEFAADGVVRGTTTLRLRRGEAALHIENRLHKPSTTVKESAFFSFGFALDQPEVRYEVTGGVTGDGLTTVPGAPQHMRAVREWVSLADPNGAVAWVTRQAPLVHPQVIALPYAPFPDSTAPREPATLYSWVHNNIWDTNFPTEQAFEATFSYAIGVDAGRGLAPTALAAATAALVHHPLVVVPARGAPRPTPVPADLSLVQVDDPRVKVVSVCATEGGDVQLRLQSFADEVLTVRVSVPTLRDAVVERSTYLGDHNETLTLEAGTFTVDLGVFGLAAVVLRQYRFTY